MEKGYFISFTGVVTFKNAEKTRKAAAVIPAERIMLETDCPYMSPEPVRKIHPNEPALMVHTAKFIAEQKGVDFDSFAADVRSACVLVSTSPATFCSGDGDRYDGNDDPDDGVPGGADGIPLRRIPVPPLRDSQDIGRVRGRAATLPAHRLIWIL